MKARQARKILHYANGGTRHQVSKYWYTRLAFYGQHPTGWMDYRITKAINIWIRYARSKYFIERNRRFDKSTQSFVIHVPYEKIRDFKLR